MREEKGGLPAKERACSWTSSSGKPPREFVCPLTLEVMEEPVFLFTSSGRSFEREALLRWLGVHPKRDPLTNRDYSQPLKFMPNRSLQEAIDRWRRKTGRQSRQSRRSRRFAARLQTSHSMSSLELGSKVSSPQRPGSLDDTSPPPPKRQSAVFPSREAREIDDVGSAVETGSSTSDALANEDVYDMAAMVRLVGTGLPRQQFGAARVLLIFASESAEKSRALAATPGAVEAIEKMLAERRDVESRLLAAKLLRVLARVAGGEAAMEPLVRELPAAARASSAILVVVLEALASADDPRPVLRYDGACSTVVSLLKGRRPPRVQHLATCLVGRLAAASDDARAALVLAGAVKPLVNLLAAHRKAACAVALTELVDASDAIRTDVVEAQPDVFEHVVTMLVAKSPSSSSSSSSQGGNHHQSAKQGADVVRGAASLAVALVENHLEYKRALAKAGGIPALVHVVAAAPVELDVKRLAAMGLVHLAGGGPDLQAEIVYAGGVIPLGRLIRDRYGSDPASKKAGILAILALVTSNRPNQLTVVREKLVAPLLSLLDGRHDYETRQLALHTLHWLLPHKDARIAAATHLGLRWRLLPPSTALLAAGLEHLAATGEPSWAPPPPIARFRRTSSRLLLALVARTEAGTPPRPLSTQPNTFKFTQVARSISSGRDPPPPNRRESPRTRRSNSD